MMGWQLRLRAERGKGLSFSSSLGVLFEGRGEGVVKRWSVIVREI